MHKTQGTHVRLPSIEVHMQDNYEVLFDLTSAWQSNGMTPKLGRRGVRKGRKGEEEQ